MKIFYFIIPALILYCNLFAQSPEINRQQFFLDDRVIEVSFTTDIKKLRTQKRVPVWQPANIVMRFSDTATISEEIKVEPRGEFRKATCDMASLMLNFKNPGSPKLSPLKKLKLVGGCHSNSNDEELLLKEYLVYKIYNFLTNMSFRVRLMHITYKDSYGKTKPYTQYSFLIEDLKDLCARNNFVEINKKAFNPAAINRQHTTFVCIFQYMVGNTDWSLPNFHNLKMLVPKADTLADCYLVPYDFDFSGVVDAGYAIPDEQLGTTSVKERVYRGPPRNTAELQQAVDIFKEKKERIMFYIKDFPLLNVKTKRSITDYLDQFWDILNTKSSIRSVFNGVN